MRALFVVLVAFLVNYGEAAKAIAYMTDNNNYLLSRVGGTVTFSQPTAADDVTVTVNVVGINVQTVHGMHVHIYGDSRLGGTSSTGSHFGTAGSGFTDPTDTNHGYPPYLTRHPGDMGNITADDNGAVSTTIVIGQGKMSLTDALRSIVGRTVIIHAGADNSSNPTGFSGTPYTHGHIGILADGTAAEAAPGSTIPIAYGVSVLSPVGAGTAGGKIFIATANDTGVSVFIDFTGLAAGAYSVGFFQYGDIKNTTESYGNLLFPMISVTQAAAGTLNSCYGLRSTQTISSLIGRTVAIFSGGTDFAHIVSIGVVGIGNNAAQAFFQGTILPCTPNGASSVVVSSWVLLVAIAALFFAL